MLRMDLKEFLNRPVPIWRLILILLLFLLGAACLGVGLGLSVKTLGKTVYLPFFPNVLDFAIVILVLDFAIVILAGILLMFLAVKDFVKGKA